MKIGQLTARSLPERHGVPDIARFRTSTGLLCLGKRDFEAVGNARHDPFFRAALGIKQMPSSARLRQRFDVDAGADVPGGPDACEWPAGGIAFLFLLPRLRVPSRGYITRWRADSTDSGHTASLETHQRLAPPHRCTHHSQILYFKPAKGPSRKGIRRKNLP